MKILLFVKDFASGTKFNKDGTPTKSGAEFHAENHAKELIKLGHDVTIMAKKKGFSTKARENIDGIDVVRLHAPFRGAEIMLRMLTTHRNFDAVYIIGRPKFAVWAILLARLLTKNIVLSLTGKAELFEKNTWRNKIFATCTRYIATTSEIKIGLTKMAGIPIDKITILPHGIAVLRYPKPDKKIRQLHRQQYRIGENCKVLLFCARVVINKGIDTIQKVWPIIHARYPDAKFFVVGGGKNELLSELKSLSLNTDNSIIVTGEQEYPQEFYQLADVYIFPSRYEGLPTSLMEAMSSGLPGVVSDIGGCEDLIFDDETGYRVPTEDYQAFAEKIMYLFEHEDERQRMGDNGAKFVRDNCDYSKVIKELAHIISGMGIQHE